LREFEEVCNTYNDLNYSMNTIKLKLFPFSLKDKAKTWLQNLRLGSIRAWDEMQQQFLKKFFPSHRTNSFKRQITTFTQKPGETFYQCWDRYKGPVCLLESSFLLESEFQERELFFDVW